MLKKSCKCKYAVWRIWEWVFVLFMAAQIVPGLCWLAGNMGHVPLFHETTLYLKAAENLVIDEYMGILYPLLIKGAIWLEDLLGLSYHVQIYILQIACAFLSAGYVVLRWLEGKADSPAKKGWTVFGALFLLTCPLLSQMHVAVLPYSLALSITAVLLSEGIYYLRNADLVTGVALIKIGGLWLLAAMLLPDYNVFVAVFMIGVFLGIVKKNKKYISKLFIMVLCTVLCFGVISGRTQTAGALGRIQKSAGSAMLLRFVWPNYMRNSFFWDEKVKTTFSEEELKRFSLFPEAAVYELGPKLEAVYGKEAADEIYWNMALTSIDLGTREIVEDVGRDFVSYICPPAALQEQMEDNKSSLTGWNYGRMQEETPVLTKYYVRTALGGWNVLCVLGIVYLLLKKRKGILKYENVLTVITMLVMAAWYTMGSSGMQDYKKAMVISFLWLLPIVKAFFEIKNQRERIQEDEKRRD